MANEHDVKEYVSDKGWRVLFEDTKREELWLKDCPFCGATSRDKSDLHFSISLKSGVHKCFRGGCEANAGGNLYTLKKAMGDIIAVAHVVSEEKERRKYTDALRAARGKFSQMQVESMHRKLMADTEMLGALEHGPLDGFPFGRGITREMVERFKLGMTTRGGSSARWLAVPFFYEGDPVLIKYRTLEGEKDFQREAGGASVLWNVDALRASTGSTCYVAEAEIDAITLEHLGFSPAVAIPAGAATFNPIWREYFEPFNRVVLFYDSDEAGDEGAAKFAEEVGAYRCVRARLDRKDANEVLQKNRDGAREEIANAIRSAAVMGGSGMLHVSEASKRLFADKKMATPGMPTGWDDFDAMIGGIRPEFWVVSGDTGIGKTTWLFRLLFELARGQKAPCLMIAPEMRLEELGAKAVVAEIGKPLLDFDESDKERALKGLADLPLYLGEYEGSIPLKTAMLTIEAFVRRHKGKVVVIDHLDFLMDISARDERQEINRVMQEIHSWPKRFGVTLILVAHPTKLRTDGRTGKTQRLTMNDILGSAKVKQLAMIIALLHRTGQDRKFLEVEVPKIRWDGVKMPGPVFFRFDTRSMKYEVVTEAEMKASRKRKKKAGTGSGTVVTPPQQTSLGSAAEPAANRFDEDLEDIEATYAESQGGLGDDR